MTIQNILQQKQVELNLINLAYYKCSNCGFIKAADCYIAISTVICCNLCGNEIRE